MPVCNSPAAISKACAVAIASTFALDSCRHGMAHSHDIAALDGVELPTSPRSS